MLCVFYAILYFQIFYKCIKVHRLVITFSNKRIKHSVFFSIVKLIANVIKVLKLSQILIKYFVCMFSTPFVYPIFFLQTINPNTSLLTSHPRLIITNHHERNRVSWYCWSISFKNETDTPLNFDSKRK